MTQKMQLPVQATASAVFAIPLTILYRVIERLVVVVMLLYSLPLWAVGELMVHLGYARLKRRRMLGRFGREFTVYRLVVARPRARRLWRRWRGDLATVWWQVLCGRMALVGPRPVTPREAKRLGWRTDELPVAARYSVLPGVVCLWWIRQRALIDYGDELGADLEYVAHQSPSRDVGVLARALVAGLLGRRREVPPRTLHLLGCRIDNWSMDEAIDELLRRAGHEDEEHSPVDPASDRDAGRSPRSSAETLTALAPRTLAPDQTLRPTRVAFVNAACMNIAAEDAEYRRVLAESDLVFADGIGVRIAGRVLKQEVRQNLCGTDLFPRLCEAMAGTGLKLFLLGAQAGVAEECALWARRRFPGLVICGTRDGYFTEAETPQLLEQIRDSGADILLVAMGAPRQEKWLQRHLEDTGARVGLGVGGLFDYYSGRIPRAPQWVRELCLEWVWRLAQEPQRLWRRYVLGNGVFLARVALAWLRRRS